MAPAREARSAVRGDHHVRVTWILTTTGDNKYALFFVVGLYVTAGVIMAFVARPRTAVAAAPAPKPA